MEHIFKMWPSVRDMARDLGKPYTTVISWRARGNIAACHDVALVRAARLRGCNLTFEELAQAREVALVKGRGKKVEGVACSA